MPFCRLPAAGRTPATRNFKAGRYGQYARGGMAQAGEAIVRRVTESKNDVDLRQLGDAIFRMRRARRSCNIGLIRMACQDYIAIIHNVAGISSEWPGYASVCPFAIPDEQSGDGRFHNDLNPSALK